jgi:hypothetical protein
MCQPAKFDERLHRLPDLVPRRVAIDVVHLVEVDVIGLHPDERLLTRTPDVERRQARMIRPVGHVPEDLGGQHDLVAA